MKHPERFDRAISALVKGFFNETLLHGSCYHCAVGNICGGEANWSDVFMTAWGEQEINESAYIDEAKEIIDKTGYSWKELAMVEYAFEKCGVDTSIKEKLIEAQYNGLIAVVEVLCEIEGISPQETKEMFSYKIEENKPVMA